MSTRAKGYSLLDWLAMICYIVTIIGAIIACIVFVYSEIKKSDLTLEGGKYGTAMENYKKLILWRPCNFNVGDKSATLVSAYEQIIDMNGNIIGTLKAEEIYDLNEHLMFSGFKVSNSVQKSVMFVQSDRGQLKLNTGEVYKLSLTYTFRYSYLLTQKEETKKDSSYTFTLKKSDIKLMRRKLLPEQVRKQGVILNLGK